MKKMLIGAIVGGLIIFLWQFVSFAATELHYSATRHTPKQEAILQFMTSQQLEDGGYFIPRTTKEASTEEMEKSMNNMKGKPWMRIEYHNSYNQDMMMNMFRGLVVNVIMIYLFIGLLKRMGVLTTGKVVTASLITGLIIFLNTAYTNHIWYQTFDTWAHLADALISWGLAGAWLGWWLNNKKGNPSNVHEKEKELEMA